MKWLLLVFFVGAIAATSVECSDEGCSSSCGVASCLEKEGWPRVAQCLRGVSAPLLWDPVAGDCCTLEAALVAAHETRRRTEADPLDSGASFLALLLGRALSARHEHARCNMSVEEHVAPFFAADAWMAAALKRESFESFFSLALARMALGDRAASLMQPTRRPVIVTVGPYGFDNEPVFAPSLGLPTRLATVFALVLREYEFPSSSVTLAVFPWSLQLDVSWAALFVAHFARLVRADWILPADSAGILSIAKMAHELHTRPLVHFDVSVMEALQRSTAWPPSYPPPHLSKLMPGHALFAPKEYLLSRSDSEHLRELPTDDVFRAALLHVGPKGYVKREFSEASRGVAQDHQGTPESARAAFSSVFTRSVGISFMDLELPVAIFLQEQVSLASGVFPVGVRFFARAGELIVGHTSVAVEGNMVYETIRDKRVEYYTCALVKATNFTGFGAAWWWRSTTRPYLIDFNARLERHACLTPVLQLTDLVNDPCYALQTGLVEEEMYRETSPHFLRAGVRYMDPVRAMSGAGPQIVRLLGKDAGIAWNLQLADEKLRALVEKKISERVGNLQSSFVKSGAS